MEREQELVLRSVQQYNILPITSVCNVSCIFCSHRQNPTGVQVQGIGTRSLEQIEEAMGFLSGDRKIVIGESATRIIEGEPFCHPQLITVLQRVRAKFRNTSLQITTNGMGLNAETVAVLSTLKPLELYISLNSANQEKRRLLMGGTDGGRVTEGIKLLSQYGVEFHGSIVAMPHLTGWEDLKQTVLFLAAAGALTIRIFLPGFTSLAPTELTFAPTLYSELVSFGEEMKRKIAVPVIVEPQILDNLDPIIEGIIIGSSAERSGFKRDDKILEVNGRIPRCRVEAFEFLSATLSSQVVLDRGGKQIQLELKREKGERIGVVMSYDLQPYFGEDLNRIIRRHNSKRPLLMVSPLAEKIITAAVSSEESLEKICRITKVDSNFFGGSIKAAGLLVIDDFIAALNSYNGPRPDLLILPNRAFDDRGRDLKGQSYLLLQEEKNIPVELLEG
jgi:sulfatase maturation enzyme AslB (radical SAM superfamily)